MKNVVIVDELYRLKNKDFNKLKKLQDNIDNACEEKYNHARHLHNEFLNTIVDTYKPIFALEGHFRQD